MESAQPGIALRVSRAARAYGPRRALNDVTLELRRGEIYALLGPNGAGKTSLIRAICGRVRLDAGSILVGESDPARDPSARRRLGLVPQEIALYPELTTRENLEILGRLAGLAPEADSRRRRVGPRVDGPSRSGRQPGLDPVGGDAEAGQSCGGDAAPARDPPSRRAHGRGRSPGPRAYPRPAPRPSPARDGHPACHPRPRPGRGAGGPHRHPGRRRAPRRGRSRQPRGRDLRPRPRADGPDGRGGRGPDPRLGSRRKGSSPRPTAAPGRGLSMAASRR